MIEIDIPRALAPFSSGSTVVNLDAAGRSVRDVLGLLADRHPGIVDRVLTESGEVRPHVNLFVGEENIKFTGGLETPVPDRAIVAIVAAVSGG